jgi:acetyl-CoA carboxylase biotin carboxyl carrier protein
LAHDALTYEDLLRIVELIKSSEQFSEFRLKVGEIEVELRRRNAAVATPATAGLASAPAASAPLAPVVAPMPAPPPAPASVAVPTAAPTTRALPELAANAIIIRAPMVGTFYRAPEPGAQPFVAVGDRVGSDTVVCIIEVMKLMNSIPAGAHGTVTHVLVEDAAPVDTGQPLIVLEPGGA